MDKNENIRITQVDQRTGEELRGCVVYFAPKRRIYPKGYVTMSQEGMKAIWENDLIGKPELKMLLLILSELTYENILPYTQTDFARRYGIAKSVINRTWKNLIEADILVLASHKGSNKYYIVNSEYAWKGKVKNYKQRDGQETAPAVQEFLNGLSATENTEEV